MPGGDSENWGEGRYVGPYNSIYKDENVVVSNGTVKLQMRKEASSWRCATCNMNTAYTNYSSATIATPYTHSFNSGRFEARIKMPTFPYAHSTFWLWHGTSINEIDIAEAFGTNAATGQFPINTYHLHAWAPNAFNQNIPNPYHLPRDASISNDFPGQGWLNYIYWPALQFGRPGDYEQWYRSAYRQDDFHTYACEWDTSAIRFYLDGKNVNTIWKYYQTRYSSRIRQLFGILPYKVGSTCNPTPGGYTSNPNTWQVTNGFPYNNQSHSNLRFTIAIDEEDPNHPSGLLGEMEIDYVKIWQLHPESPWTDLCPPPLPATVSGPNVVCGNTTYTVSPVSPNGAWETNYANLDVVSVTPGSITVKPKSGSNGLTDEVVYDGLGGTDVCSAPSAYIFSRQVDVGKPGYIGVVSSEVNGGYRGITYHFTADHLGFNLYFYPQPTLTFEWDIYYGPNFSLHHHAVGHSISTPPFFPANYNERRNFKWNLKVSNSCGSLIKGGQLFYENYEPVSLPDEALMLKGSFDTTNGHLHVFAEITDSAAYRDSVIKRVSNVFFTEETDSVTVEAIIERIAMEELFPYLLRKEAGRPTGTLQKRAPADLAAPAIEAEEPLNRSRNTRAYPNPAQASVSIELSDAYRTAEDVVLSLTDVLGNPHKELRFKPDNNLATTIDISGLPNGVFLLVVEQGALKERIKVVKQ